jgi:4-hydroxy-2-oxoheptanedioate aldolase
MLENRVKPILRARGTAIGAFTGCLAAPEVVEIIGHVGFDGVFIGMEHMPFDLREIQRMLIAAERVGTTPMVRTSGFDPALILRLLDFGTQGIHVPHIDLYVGEVSATRARTQGKGRHGFNILQKFRRVPA